MFCASWHLRGCDRMSRRWLAGAAGSSAAPRRTARLGSAHTMPSWRMDDTHKGLLKTHMQNGIYASMSTWRVVSSDVSQGSIFYH